MNEKELFQSFLTDGTEPPMELQSRVLSRIAKELCPSIPRSVAKLLACNATGSVLTLLLCPQYGLSLTGAQGVMPWLMGLHPALCFFVCGLLWMLGGQFLAKVFLSWDEQRVLSGYYWGAGFSFILVSVLAFACIGSLTLDGWLIAWGLGAVVVTSAFTFRLRARVRRIEIAAQLVVSSGR